MLAARERVFGTDHPRTLASRNNLAVAYRETGRAAEAIPLCEQNLEACERLLGADHPKIRATWNNLALACQDAAQAEQAYSGEHRLRRRRIIQRTGRRPRTRPDQSPSQQSAWRFDNLVASQRTFEPNRAAAVPSLVIDLADG